MVHHQHLFNTKRGDRLAAPSWVRWSISGCLQLR